MVEGGCGGLGVVIVARGGALEGLGLVFDDFAALVANKAVGLVQEM